MAQLFLQPNITGDFVVLGFAGTLRRILISRAIWHDSTSCNKSYRTNVALQTAKSYSDKVGELQRRTG